MAARPGGNIHVCMAFTNGIDWTLKNPHMQKSGGIVAVIAGVFGTGAAIITLVVGGIASAVEVEGAGTVVGLGWGGMLFSFATIVLGAVAMTAKGRVAGVLLMACAVGGAVLGGTFVAVFMALALIGGLLATFGRPKEPTP